MRPFTRLHVSPTTMRSAVKRYTPKSPRIVVESPRREIPMPSRAVRVRIGRCVGSPAAHGFVDRSRSSPRPCAANRNEPGMKSKSSRDGAMAAVPRMTTRRAIRKVVAAAPAKSSGRCWSCVTWCSCASGSGESCPVTILRTRGYAASVSIYDGTRPPRFQDRRWEADFGPSSARSAGLASRC